MYVKIGDKLIHPENGESGEVIAVETNPACLLRTLVIQWENGETDEWSELEFGPLEDAPNPGADCD